VEETGRSIIVEEVETLGQNEARSPDLTEKELYC
jgi:hypothetical protein